MSVENKIEQANVAKTEKNPKETEAWNNLLIEYGPTVISRADYDKVKAIPAELAGHYIISEATACQECSRIIRAQHEPFPRDGILEDCLDFGLCQEHEEEKDKTV